MQRRIVIIILFVTCFSSGNAQNEYADSLKNVLSATTHPVERFNLLNKLVDNIFTQGAGNIDYSLCGEMVRLAQQLKNDSLLAIAYNTVGNYFLLNNGDFSNALEYFFKGIPRAEKANDKRRLSSLYIDIAVVYYRLNNPDEQIKYLRKAKDNLPDITSSLYYFMLAQVQTYFGRYFILKHNYDSALHFAFAFMKTNRQLKSPVYGCAVQSQMGIIYEAMGDTAKARMHYGNAIRGADSLNYFYIKLSVKPPFIDFLIKTDNITEAVEQARQLMNLGLERRNADVKRMAAGFLRKIAEYNKQMDSAYFYARMESELKDSVLTQNNINKIQSLVFSEQLRVMEEEAKKAAEEEQRKLNIQYVSIALGILTFVIIFLLLSHRFIIHARLIRFLIIVALLMVFEFLNLVLHPFLERITHHNPFLMLLALVCIAALLVPLHHRLEERTLHILVEKNKKVKENAEKNVMSKAESDC